MVEVVGYDMVARAQILLFIQFQIALIYCLDFNGLVTR